MGKYRLDKEGIISLAQIRDLLEQVILKETGATAEVTINKTQVLVYTEETEKAQSIKELMQTSRQMIRECRYEADEDGPAAITMVFSL